MAAELAVLALSTLLLAPMLALSCVKKFPGRRNLPKASTRSGAPGMPVDKSCSVKGNTVTAQETTIQVPSATVTGTGTATGTTTATKPSVTLDQVMTRLTRESTKPLVKRQQIKLPGEAASEDCPTPSEDPSRPATDETDALSYYESRRTGSKARHVMPPEIPPPSPRARERRRDRKPLGFAKRGRVTLVPMDQMESWVPDKSRVVHNPERRDHVVRTLSERGGWLIDRSAPDTGEVDANGERIQTYIYTCPKA